MTTKQPPTAMPIRLQVLCMAPPPGTYQGQPTEFGLQDKRQILHPGTPEGSGALRFRCEVTARPGAGGPDFGGPFVHGPPGSRFLYLGWRPLGGTWIRRLKLPLTAITLEQVEAASRGLGGVLVAQVSGIGSGKVPLMGEGWTVADD